MRSSGPSSHRWARHLLLLGGAIVLVALVFRIGPGLIADMLRRLGAAFFLVTLLYGAHVAVRAFALQRSLPRGTLRYIDLLRVRLAVEAVEDLTFTGPFLAQPAEGRLLTERGLSNVDAYGAVAIELLLYSVVSVSMATVALAFLLARGVLPPVLGRVVVGILVVLNTFLAACAKAAWSGAGLIVPALRAAGRILGRAWAARAAAWTRWIDPIERVLVAFMHDTPGRLVEVLLIESAGHALLMLEVWVVIHSLGLPAQSSDPFIIEGASKVIGMAFFFVPGQFGASESVYTALFELIGLGAAAGLVMALVRRVRALAVAGVALLVLSTEPR